MDNIDATVSLSDIKVDEEFYEKIDRCFRLTGFKLLPDSNDFLTTGVMMGVPEVDGWTVVEWPHPGLIMPKGCLLMLRYSIQGNTGNVRAVFTIDVNFSECMVADRLLICSSVCESLFCYDEFETDFILRLQFLARELHRTFDAAETMGEDGVYAEEPLFRFSKEEWLTIGKLPLEKCEVPHFRIWAKNPEKPVTRDYLRKGNIRPNPDRWKPDVPVAFDSEFREFHLTYVDDSGMKRIALLRNCLCCGGVFPCSWRDSRFGRPSEDERQKFREIGWAAGSLDEVAEVLGKSDFHLGSVIYGRKKLNAEKGIRDMAVYTDISDDAVVIFKEYNQGMIITNYAGKWQGGS